MPGQLAPPAAAAPPAPAAAPAQPPAQASPLHEPVSDRSGQVGGPVSVAWREGTLTRALELEALRAWVLANGPLANSKPLSDAVLVHLQAAREAATAAKLKPRKWLRPPRSGPLIRPVHQSSLWIPEDGFGDRAGKKRTLCRVGRAGVP